MILKRCFTLSSLVVGALLLPACASHHAAPDQQMQQAKMNIDEGHSDVAFRQLMALAEQGDAQAQYSVGYMYYKGTGVDQDSRAAYYWIEKAADQGHKDAIKALVMLGDAQPEAANSPHSASRQNVQRTALEVTPLNSADADKPQGQARALAVSTPVQFSRVEQHGPKQVAITAAEPVPAETQVPHQVGNGYALQFAADYHLNTLQKIITKHRLGSMMTCWRSQHNGRAWYVLTYGTQYASLGEARLAKDALPAKLQSFKSFPRSTATSQKIPC